MQYISKIAKSQKMFPSKHKADPFSFSPLSQQWQEERWGSFTAERWPSETQLHSDRWHHMLIPRKDQAMARTCSSTLVERGIHKLASVWHTPDTSCPLIINRNQTVLPPSPQDSSLLL